jgi:hypothetical protein
LKRKPSQTKDTDDVRNNQASGGVDRLVRADLYVRTAAGQEWYFEMKTPQPNKGQCKEMKRFILLVAALRYETRGEAFAAMAYNPLGDGQPIRDGKIKQFLEPGTDILMGRQFWTKIGEASTYDDLLDISEQVGQSFESLLISEGIVEAP